MRQSRLHKLESGTCRCGKLYGYFKITNSQKILRFPKQGLIFKRYLSFIVIIVHEK